MSKRSEIIDGSQAASARAGLVYTEVLGWLDLGHARGDDIRILMKKIDAGEAMRADRYDITYVQSMVSPYRIIRVGKFIRWRIRKGRPSHERKRIALAMMMTMARRFEVFQGSFPNNMVTDSGFSGEDLVSDLLGFYRVISIQNPFSMLQPVSKEEALKRWDYYGKIGSWKNETFRPLLFPDPERFPNAKPQLGQLPNFMQTIQPYQDWKSGNVTIATMNGSFIQDGKKRDLMV
ncbi:hypothetical protein Z042_10910 [Chania multitudinisentens RB-25]|uniref:Uncharacterized protein n=1 Tax=Chania multitudinisentens RB-25 TaxID=1441930 RepID=W0L8M1_9GAMM|nr:hypothetical protein [Chania multitudinisentens]AHG20081.1 hypothetical protein Z042_10910 [Chania multitudinisentens RB-25]